MPPSPDWTRLRPKKTKGEPVGTWAYLTADGDVAFYVARWKPKNPNKRKVIRPVTWCQFPNGREGWTLKALPAPRPLYNLPAILEAPTKRVIVVEGEKCADAAALIFPDCVVTAWAGGANAWLETDWESARRSRGCCWWQTPTSPAATALKAIADALAALGCTVCAHLPDGNDKDDIADWLTSDGSERTRERIEAEAEQREAAAATTADSSVAESDDEAIARLAALPELEYEQVRKAEAKRLDIRTAVLDKLMRQERSGNEGDHLQGRPIEWNEPEPWPEPTDGEALLADIAGLIRRYVDLPDSKADAVTLWIVHTFLHRNLDLSTILILKSATKRCGKTLLMEIAGALSWRSEPVSGRITPAAMFRLIQLHEPTLFLDEADTYMGEDSELRGILNGSHSRGSASTIRNVGEDHEPRRFSTWCPKAISGIGNLPDTVEDRAVIVRLERRSPTASDMPHWRDRDRRAVEALKRKLIRWTDDSVDAVLGHRSAVAFPSSLNDRARDTWEALLAVGDIAGGEWAGRTGRASPGLRSNQCRSRP